MRESVLVLICGMLAASAVHAGDNSKMFGQIIGGILGGNGRAAPAQQQQQQQQPKGVAQALSILQALQGGGQAPAPAQAQAAPAAPTQAMDPKDAAKMALLSSLLSGKKLDLKEVAGQALAAKLGGGDPNDPKAALKAALAQKLLSGERLDIKELAGTALAAKFGGSASALSGGGAAAPAGLSSRDRLEAMLLQKLLSGERLDVRELLVQHLADKAEARSAALAAQDLRPGSKAALKNALINELLGGGGLGGRSLQGELVALLQRKAGLQDLGATEKQALLAMIAPQAAAPAASTAYGAALSGGAPAGPALAAPNAGGYGSALAPSAPSSSQDQAQVDALMAELQGYQQAAPAQAPAAVTAPNAVAPPGDGQAQIDALMAELQGYQQPAPVQAPAALAAPNAVAPPGDAQARIDALMAELQGYQQPAAPPPPPTTPAVTRSSELQARIDALQERQEPERIRIPFDSRPDAPPDAVAPGPVPDAVTAPPANTPRMVAGIDLDDLARRDPGSAAALARFSPEVLEAAAALLAAQRGGAAGPALVPAPESAPAPVVPAPAPVVPAPAPVVIATGVQPEVPTPTRPRGAGPLAALRTGSSDRRPGSRLAALRARRARAEAPQPRGRWSDAEREELETEIQEYWYADMGITRFSRREQRMRADAQVSKTLEAVLAGEEAWPPVVEDAGGSQVAPRREVRRATAAREFTVREKLVLHEKISEEVFAREGIDRFSNRAAKVRAEAIVKSLVTQAMEDGSALDYLAE